MVKPNKTGITLTPNPSPKKGEGRRMGKWDKITAVLIWLRLPPMQLQRKLDINLLVLAGTATSIFIAANPHPAKAQTIANGQYRVRSVSDGDTIKIVNPNGGNPIPVRLACIDAPDLRESQTPQALRARDRLSQILQQGGMQVQLTVTGQDRYQRPIAEARLTNGTLVQGVMVREGLATFQPQYIRSCPNAATELQSAAGN